MSFLEIILLIEAVTIFVLLVLLLLIVVRRKISHTNRYAGEQTVYVPTRYTDVQAHPVYPGNYYYRHIPVENTAGRGNDSYFCGYGYYPYGPAGGAAPYAGGTYPYPSPVIGRERTLNRFHRDPRDTGRTGHGPVYINSRTDSVGKHREKRWRVDFMDMSSGRHVWREFSDELVVGRQMPTPLESGRLYLSMDATVSRSQFALHVTESGILIENMSKVNITRKNGFPLWQPVLLEEGDVLELGRMRYMVREISPAA